MSGPYAEQVFNDREAEEGPCLCCEAPALAPAIDAFTAARLVEMWKESRG